ncbi:uncharacterized protein EV422DRAFT_545800 [Fimicolochytrium jonesii]|uniref:uncharacterized protein n=1 Tax=Fimicolochytrium jonesii TaxID=1396493 RepID=UPI0022FE99FE|nr:uncharacterized protein EV422DRAFT_545800 [Fimicolochytrium jonesii]KAI8816382.1 hypothetical protein EV422DRAFT_545800 [Fimicolochytrium jonesii]
MIFINRSQHVRVSRWNLLAVYLAWCTLACGHIASASDTNSRGIGTMTTMQYLATEPCAGPSHPSWEAARLRLVQAAKVATSDVTQIKLNRLIRCDPSAERQLELRELASGYIGNTRRARQALCHYQDSVVSVESLQAELQDLVTRVDAVEDYEEKILQLLEEARQDPQCSQWAGRNSVYEGAAGLASVADAGDIVLPDPEAIVA